jgi:BlaI family penicillinase repressor
VSTQPRAALEATAPIAKSAALVRAGRPENFDFPPLLRPDLRRTRRRSSLDYRCSRSTCPMSTPKLTPLEMRIMDVLWASGRCSVREIQEGFPESDRPAYTTVQTMVYRLERKKAVRRAKKISNANIFEPILTRDAARGRFIDELLGLFGSRMQPLMAHLIESGKLTLGDVKEAEEALRKLAKKGEKSGE